MMAREGKAAPTKAQLRARAQCRSAVLRAVLQLLFLVLAPGAFSSAFNGVKYLLGQVGSLQVVELSSFLLTLLALLAYTVVAGRFFCGYACAFGTVGDALFWLFAPLRKALRVPALNAAPGWLQAALRMLKFVLLGAIALLCLGGAWGAVSGHSPWTAFGLIAGGTFSGLDALGLGLLACIFVLQGLFERSFCRYLCPMGAVFALMPVLPFSQFKRVRGRCGLRPCNRCLHGCPMGIYPDADAGCSGECIACGKCAGACPLANVGVLGLEPAAAQAGDPAPEGTGSRTLRPKPRLKGSEPALVLAKAAVLLAVMWACGLVRSF
ncbi:MAG: 4Fe-4S binding protein [Coriobacteriales bacterium]